MSTGRKAGEGTVVDLVYVVLVISDWETTLQHYVASK